MDIQGMRCADALEHLAASTGIRERLHGFPERTAALESLIRRCAGTPGASLSDVASVLALDTDADLHDAAAEKVALMTFHASKGLEFPVVFIAGCEDGFLPFRHRDHRCEDMAEERRLFYVGITRAMDQLFLTSAKTRFIHGRSEKRTLSPFVSDIERQLLHHHAGSTRPPRKAGMQLGLFPEP